MKYESNKAVAAGLSVISIIIAFAAVLVDVLPWSKYGIIFIAALISAIGAGITLYISRQLAEKRKMRQVFLIYAKEDIEKAKSLAQELKQRGFNPWLDIDEILPGQVWKKAVLSALEESSAALVLITENLAAKKGFVIKELEAAMEVLQENEKGISPVIPVRLSDSVKVPDKLSHIQWVNLFEKDGMDLLFRGLKRATAMAQQTH